MLKLMIAPRPLSFILVLALLWAPCGSAAAADLVPSADIVSRLDKARAALDARETQLEAAYGYSGSKLTVRKAFEAAELGAATRRSSMGSSAVYVLWREVKPWFARHRDALSAVEAVVRAQGGATPGDVVWVDQQVAAVREASLMLEGTFEQLVELQVSQASAAAEVGRLNQDLKSKSEMLARLGGDDGGAVALVRDAVELATAKAYAARASESWLTDATRADVARPRVGTLQPVSDRVTYTVTGVRLPGVVTPAAPAPGSGGTALVEREEQALGRLEALSAEASSAAAEAEAASKAAAEIEVKLVAVRRPADLEEVAALLSREAELSATLESHRKRIAETALDTPGGREAAQALAAEVLEIRKELPRVKAELKAKSSDKALARWRKARESELVARVSEWKKARLTEAKARARMATARRDARAARSKAAMDRLDDTLRRVKAMQTAVAFGPPVTRVSVLADGAEVMGTERMSAARLEEMARELAEARRVLSELLRRSGPVERALIGAAMDAVEVELSAPRTELPPWEARAVGRAARELGIAEIVGDDLVAVKGQAIAARYAKLEQAPLSPGEILLLRAEAPVMEAKSRYGGADGLDVGTAVQSAAETLGLVIERLEGAASSKSRGYRSRVDVLVATAGEAGKRRRKEAEAHLKALLHVPVIEAADAALASAVEVAGALSEAYDAALAKLDPATGFAKANAGQITEGQALEVRAWMAGIKAPQLKLGEAGLPLVTGGSRDGQWTWRQARVGKLGGAGRTEVTVELSH